MSSYDNILEQEHNKFVESNLFCFYVREKIENAHFHKYDGIVPDEIILIPEQTLERLKDFETCKEWKNNPSILK